MARRFLRVPEVQFIAPRLFADGLLSARLEIMLAPDEPPRDDGLEWLKRLLEIPAEVRSSRPGKRSPQRETIKLDGVAKRLPLRPTSLRPRPSLCGPRRARTRVARRRPSTPQARSSSTRSILS